MALSDIIERMPKAELHVHIEGCLEPDLVLKLAERSDMQQQMPYKTLAEAEAAFQYDNLQEFLDLRDATLQVRQHTFVGLCSKRSSLTAAASVCNFQLWHEPGTENRARLL